MVIVKNKIKFSKDIIKLFNKDIYETFILNLMNTSKVVFKDNYKKVVEQSNGECDFISLDNGSKYDAKLPFLSKQIELLTDGKKHKPQVEKWLQELQNETFEFNPYINVESTKLYQIMNEQIHKDKSDESIIFFLPYPVVFAAKNNIFPLFSTDYLNKIYNVLKNGISTEKRKIYVIYPSSERNAFALRNLTDDIIEIVDSDEIEKYLSYEIVNYDIKK